MAVKPVKIGLVVSRETDDKKYLEAIMKGLILKIRRNEIIIINVLQESSTALIPDQDMYLYGISPDFVVDVDCVNLAETFPGLKLNARHTPILFRPIDGWRRDLEILAKRQALPNSKKTEVDKYMSQYSRLDDAAADVSRGIREIVETLLAGGK